MNTCHSVTGVGRILLLCASAALCVAAGQPSQTFDVAAIRANVIGASAGTGFDFNGFRLRVTNATLQFLIRSAYGIQGEQIVGGPSWLDEDRYDIEANTGSTLTPDQFRTMLQNLLENRFELKFHRETRQMTVYSLLIEKGGVRFKEDTEGGGTRLSTDMDSGKAVLSGTRVSMDQLAGYISNKLGRLVLNRTDLKGVYDFTFTWDAGQAAGSTDPSIFAGLREQLGLQLGSAKSPVEVLVIEYAAKPSGN
ncbi:MAG TPA: TIGR03435 family protein [Bryobacteraceae bacterium]|nr:TIGR03435 family protein [Bryobacteraceae bacterium]